MARFLCTPFFKGAVSSTDQMKTRNLKLIEYITKAQNSRKQLPLSVELPCSSYPPLWCGVLLFAIRKVAWAVLQPG